MSTSCRNREDRLLTRANPRLRGAARGFSLIEVLISLVLLAVMFMTLAPITMRVARLSTGSTVATQRTAVLAGEAQRLELVDFADLAAGTTCYDFSAADFPHTKCVTITVINAISKRVTVVVTPTGGVADTATVERSQGGRYNPLKP